MLAPDLPIILWSASGAQNLIFDDVELFQTLEQLSNILIQAPITISYQKLSSKMTTNGTPKIDSRRYACETRVVAGLGTISTIPTELSMNHISHPIVVSDAGIANAGLLDKWLAPEVAKIPRVLSKVNPDLTDVEEGLKVAKDHGCDGIVIIGGGSALCLGKAISIALTNPGHISDYEGFGKVKTVSRFPRITCFPLILAV